MNMDSEKYRKELKQKLIESAAKVVYTYTAHWKMVDHFESWNWKIKIGQIVFTGIASCGLLSLLFSNYPYFPIVCSAFAFMSLCLNLYSLHSNLPNQIKQHIDAANELWLIRESYMTLITDFDVLTTEKIRAQRDYLTAQVHHVNKTYPGTSPKSYSEAQIALKQKEEQTFNAGEAEKILNLDTNSRPNKKND